LRRRALLVSWNLDREGRSALAVARRPDRGRLIPRGDHAEGLTERQLQVLGLVAIGMTNAEIATRLGLSERTARKHVEDILRRLCVPNRVAAARWWFEHRD
jgi:DNA-binding NarL/FixJ family response regulator